MLREVYSRVFNWDVEECSRVLAIWRDEGLYLLGLRDTDWENDALGLFVRI